MVSNFPDDAAYLGLDPGQNSETILSCTSGTFTITGIAANIEYHPLNTYTMSAQAGAYSISGQPISISYSGAKVQYYYRLGV